MLDKLMQISLNNRLIILIATGIILFIGIYNGKINPNKNEVDDWKWIKVEKLKQDIIKNPEKYSYWFKILIKRF